MTEQKLLPMDSPAAEGDPWYFPTVRQNLLAVLSSGVLMPGAGYIKKAPDLLDLMPGRVPLFRRGTVGWAAGGLETGGPGQFPVILELLPEASTPGPVGIRLGSADMWAPSASFPVHLIVAAHFRTDKELEDFKARMFGNIPSLAVNFAVTPGLFENGLGKDPLDRNALQDAGASMKPAAFDAIRQAARRADAACGALASLAAALPRSPEWFGAAAAMAGGMPNTKWALEFPWLGRIPSWVVSGKEPEGLRGDSAVLWSAFLEFARAEPSKEWRPSEVLIAISERASSNADPLLKKWRDYCESVLEGGSEPPPMSDNGSIARRAVLLALLRSKPEEVLKAGGSVLAAGENVRAAASLLAGAAQGFARMASSFKEPSSLMAGCSSFAAWAIGKAADSESSVVSQSSWAGAVRSTRIDDLHDKLELRLGGKAVVEGVSSPGIALEKAYVVGKEAGVSFTLDRETGCLLHEVELPGGRHQTVMIREGGKCRKGLRSIRIFSKCIDLSTKTGEKKLTKPRLLGLLERNSMPAMRCRYAVSRDDQAVIAVVDQISETLDHAELISHLEEVAQTADQLEAEEGQDRF